MVQPTAPSLKNRDGNKSVHIANTVFQRWGSSTNLKCVHFSLTQKLFLDVVQYDCKFSKILNQRKYAIFLNLYIFESGHLVY